jgi:hypothetical protein
MLGLSLRLEFRGKILQGTQIDLTNPKKTGATQIPAPDFLEITYPTSDLIGMLRAAAPGQSHPIALMGERGLGKSHLLGALYHALKDGTAASAWLSHWANVLGDASLASLPLRSGLEVVTASLHQQRFRFLWDVLFEQHPDGKAYRVAWEHEGANKTDVPSMDLLLKMFKQRPTALILDEFQTWFDGLVDTPTVRHRTWAFNFIQILSEISAQQPDIFLLVVSIRNGNSDAFGQVQRINPVLLNFGGAYAKRDRRGLLLHRLFENRLQVHDADIDALIATHIAEYLRLADIPSSHHAVAHHDFVEAWPFAPHLLQLLDDQILVATSAQYNRDLVKILAGLFKSRGSMVPVLTAADFRIDNEESGIGPLLDSVNNPQHRALRDKARRNLEAVTEAVDNAAKDVPHLEDVIASLWLRSIAAERTVGATRTQLQIDCTRDVVLDANAFPAELDTILDNSFNLHEVGDRLVFREEENAEAKLKAAARNPKLFAGGEDEAHLAKELRYVIYGDPGVPLPFRVIALPKTWLADPWTALADEDKPGMWDNRIPILVLPETPDRLSERLAQWLKDHLQQRRNAVRFLLPRAEAPPVFTDPTLLFHARAVVKATEWQGQGPEYGKLRTKYQKLLRDALKDRYDRFAILAAWDNQTPAKSRFTEEKLKVRGSEIPKAMDEVIATDLFEPEAFADYAIEAAKGAASVKKVLDELKEPRPAPADTIPWLGDALMKEKLISVCAQGKITINVQDRERLERRPGEEIKDACTRLRGKLPDGKQLEEVILGLPGAGAATHGAAPQPGTGNGATPGATPPPVAGPGGTGTAPPPGGNPGGTTSPPPGGGTPQPGFGEGPPGNLFGNGGAGIFGGSGTAPPRPRIRLEAPKPTSGLNLAGQLEMWSITPATPVQSVTITLEAATGAQLKKLLEKLPDGMIYGLALDREDGPA